MVLRLAFFVLMALGLSGFGAVACLSVVMGFGLWLINPGYIGLLFNTGLGHKLLAIAVVSLALGGLTMRSITKRTLS